MAHSIDIDGLNAMDRDSFVATLGAVFEHSPWIATGAWDRRPFADVAGLHAAIMDVVAGSCEYRRVALLRAHPDLAGKAALAGDVTALAGRRIGILGGCASAFDNANFALEQGVAETHIFMRRRDMPRINPIRYMEAAGFMRHFADLDDAEKYRGMTHFLAHSQPPTNDTFERAKTRPGFRLHLGAPWQRVETPDGEYQFDFLVVSTGLVTDVALRPELAGVAADIARWSDRYTPPPGEECALIDRHPYLGPDFSLSPRTPDGADRLYGLFFFNFGALASMGLSAAALSGMKLVYPA